MTPAVSVVTAGIVLIFGVFALITFCFVFWIWMFVAACSHDEPKNRVLWILLLVFTGLLGAITYFLAEYLP